MMAGMRNLQPITHNGQLAAIVIAGHAIINERLPPAQHSHVQAMCLYAIQIQDRNGPGAYRDADAERYARRAGTRA